MNEKPSKASYSSSSTDRRPVCLPRARHTFTPVTKPGLHKKPPGFRFQLIIGQGPQQRATMTVATKSDPIRPSDAVLRPSGSSRGSSGLRPAFVSACRIRAASSSSFRDRDRRSSRDRPAANCMKPRANRDSPPSSQGRTAPLAYFPGDNLSPILRFLRGPRPTMTFMVIAMGAPLGEVKFHGNFGPGFQRGF